MYLFDDSTRVSTDLSSGEGLYGPSVSELDERTAICREEILRLEGQRVKKQTESGATQTIFGKKP